MNKSIFVVILLALTANFLSAQRGGRGGSLEERATQRTERLTTDLSLSEAQAEKINAVFVDYGKKFTEARSNAEGDREAMREMMGTLRSEQNEELQKYLTKEQFEKYLKLEAEQRERRRRRGGERDGGERQKKSDNNGEKKTQ